MFSQYIFYLGDLGSSLVSRNYVPFLRYYLLILRVFGFIGKGEGGYGFHGVEVLKCPPSIAFPRMYETARDDRMYDLCSFFAVRTLERDLLAPQAHFFV